MDTIQYKTDPDKLTIILPIKRNWLLLTVLTIALIVWIGMTISIFVFLFQEWRGWILSVMLVVWLFIWYFVGRTLWDRWKYYAADQEHLYFEKDILILHRQAFVFSITDGYDRQYVKPLHINEQTQSLSFAYGSRRIDFGYNISQEEIPTLIKTANQFYFPNWDDDEE